MLFKQIVIFKGGFGQIGNKEKYKFVFLFVR